MSAGTRPGLVSVFLKTERCLAQRRDVSLWLGWAFATLPLTEERDQLNREFHLCFNTDGIIQVIVPNLINSNPLSTF